MGVALGVLVLAGEFTGDVNGINLGSDNAEPGDEDIGSVSPNVSDLDEQIAEMSIFANVSSSIENQEMENVSSDVNNSISEATVEIVMEQANCSRTEAMNALLTHDKNIDEAVSFLQPKDDDAQSFVSESSVPPISRPMLPSGRVWGVQSEIFATSQIGDGKISEEAVVVTAKEGFPADRELGIYFEDDDGIIFKYPDLGKSDSWAHNHTNLHVYSLQKYRFTKVNAHKVDNREEFDKAINSLKPGDPVTFTLAKSLYSQGDVHNQLFSVCRSGDVGIFKRIIDSNQAIDFNKGLEGARIDLEKLYGGSAYEGSTVLHLACDLGHLSIVQELLRNQKVKVNATDSNSRTPLFVACYCDEDRSNVVRLLLGHAKIDVNKTDQNKFTPLCWACLRGHLKIVQQLIERKNTDVNTGDPQGITPLMRGAMEGHSTIVECLLSRPDIDTTKKGGHFYKQTALEHASQEGHTEIVEMLTDHENKKSSK